jgi:hypothetical protein
MKRAVLSAVLAAAISISPAALARSSHHSSASHHSTRSHSNKSRSRSSRNSASHSHGSRAYPGVRRDARGRIARSGEAKDQFRKTHPCPATGKRYGACPGYVIDHVQALKHGGADAPYNMQWQTNAEAKAKDKWE